MNALPDTVRLDAWACTYLAPTSRPFELARTGSVFRGMRDESDALQYARTVAAFFAAQGCARPVYVVRGPTSTARTSFEVACAPCGYLVAHKIEPGRPQSADAAI